MGGGSVRDRGGDGWLFMSLRTRGVLHWMCIPLFLFTAPGSRTPESHTWSKISRDHLVSIVYGLQSGRRLAVRTQTPCRWHGEGRPTPPRHPPFGSPVLAKSRQTILDHATFPRSTLGFVY